MKQTIPATYFHFPNQTDFYRGKVRDVYYFGDKIAMVTTDRISAFDHILNQAIPSKGKILNGVATHFLKSAESIVPTWLEASPHPNLSIGKMCKPIMLEMVIRGYLAGHSWREYKAGKRIICGVQMPDGMKEGQAFPTPIITPATKAEEGHDIDISREDILAQHIVTEEVLDQLYDYTYKLFALGSKYAHDKGLILVDTKYEFGLYNGEITLMDEIHTPDSSRYYILDGYQERLDNNTQQKQLSKEFVREWLMDNNFQGKDGQILPDMPESFVDTVTKRYTELYTTLIDTPLAEYKTDDVLWEMETALSSYFD
jgi:phosphoribosylaminoimidazole-succinocarboxamide synthase